MMNSFIQELEQESVSTGKLLERIPEDKLLWRPHPKSMTLGQLGLHLAEIPGRIAQTAEQGTVSAAELGQQSQATTKAEILSRFSESISSAKTILNAMNDAKLSSTWTLTDGGKTLLELPIPALCRVLMLNHWFHHRGQLTVYLRLLDVAVPSVYGPSADENPFA